MNELTLSKIKYELPKINYDLADIKSEIEIIVKKYDGLIVREEDIANIKKEIATINKLSKSLDTARKDTAKEIKKPITDFETDIKALVSELNGVSSSLKEQANVFTEKQKELKRQEIFALEDFDEFIVFDEKWLNSNVSMKAIKTNIELQLQVYRNNELMIKTTCLAVGLDKEKYCVMLYMRQNIQSIIETINNDKEVKEQYQDKEPTKVVKVTKEDIADQDVYTFTLKVTGTRVQLKVLKEFLKDNELEYEKL
jgi:hypothetical protein